MAMWAPKWSSTNKLDGHREHLMLWHQWLGFDRPAVFTTRQACREFISDHYGYIRNRPDLKREPHGWRMPVAVKVKIEEE